MIHRYNDIHVRSNDNIVKVSDLNKTLDAVPNDTEVVMGEQWLPERLVNTTLDGKLLFLEFDNAPEETQGDDEARGFVEHEIEMIRQRVTQIVNDTSDPKAKTDALVALFLMAHESSSSDIIEILEDPEAQTPL
jgi:hypothetical protein